MEKDQMHYDEQDLRIIDNSGLLRTDANESVFFARQLEHVRAKTYDIKRPELSAWTLFPIDTSVGSGAKTITYRQYDQVGAAKIIAAYSDDLPRSDIIAKEFTSNVRSIGGSYGYSVQEIRYAQQAGVALESKKAAATRRASDQTINQLAWYGDADHGLPGFLTNANIPGYVVPADGTGSSKLWSTKTPDQIIRDMNGIVNAVFTQTKGVHRANELWLPLAQYAYIASTPRSSTSDTTILDFFLKSNPFVQRVVPVLELDNAMSSGTLDTMIAIENSIDNYQMNLCMPFMQHSPQAQNLEFVVPTEARFAGVTFEYPMCAAIADSI